MAVWWICESIPIPITALLPLVLFPMLGVGEIRATAAPYANPLIFLFLGGFLIALGMERWNLHRRMALNIIRVIGTEPKAIIIGFMVAGAFLSMWVSNSATAMMMLPIGLSVIALTKPSGDGLAVAHDYHNFAVVLMLGIAYGCSVGGLGTLIGTPPNALLAGFLNETYGLQIGFAQWMMVGVPLVIVGLPIVYLVLTRVVFPIKLKELSGGKDLIQSELKQLGPITMPERLVAFVFVGVAVLWMTRPLLSDWLPGLSDAGIAIIGAVLLFAMPVNLREGEFVMDWETAKRMPWDVLLLFGGGLTLASGIKRTGLAEWIGMNLNGVGAWPIILVILAISFIIIMLTELTSNTATAAAFLPILASVAIGIGQDPMMLLVPATLAASCAFMMPVATPPNAIVYSSGTMTIPEMARAGLVLNIMFSIIITTLAYVLLMWVFDVQVGIVPMWANGA